MSNLRTTTVNDTGFLKLPAGTTAQRPTPEVGMIRYNTDIQNVEYYSDQGAWEPIQALPFKERTVITTAYMMGGYKDEVTWNNVNRVYAASDTTVNLGDNSLDRSFNYKSGACNLNVAFVFGAPNAHNATSNYTTAYNMRTETQYVNQTKFNLRVSRGHTGTIFQETLKCWVVGGGEATAEEFDLTTETNVLIAGAGTAGDTGATRGNWAMSHENFGIVYTSTYHGNFHYATKTLTARSGTIPGNHTQQKSVQSKIINCYAGNEGDYTAGNNLRRTNMITNTTSGTVPKPVTNCGEENLTMGQDHQYMLGCYNGLQNNLSWRFNYATESGSPGSSSLEPKGKAGASSGVCAWRS